MGSNSVDRSVNGPDNVISRVDERLGKEVGQRFDNG